MLKYEPLRARDRRPETRDRRPETRCPGGEGPTPALSPECLNNIQRIVHEVDLFSGKAIKSGSHTRRSKFTKFKKGMLFNYRGRMYSRVRAEMSTRNERDSGLTGKIKEVTL